MHKFLFQSDPINGYEFNPISMDIHLGLIKIPSEEIYYDYPITNAESITVGTERKKVLNELQTTLPGNFKDMENSSQPFGLHTMRLDKHGPEQGSILRNQIGNEH